eukprot:Hpha_TRINITY_DN11383_c0_g1::TRINITY_DN11383_c0_g1_i1::g.63295::m.63295
MAGSLVRRRLCWGCGERASLSVQRRFMASETAPARPAAQVISLAEELWGNRFTRDVTGYWKGDPVPNRRTNRSERARLYANFQRRVTLLSGGRIGQDGRGETLDARALVQAATGSHSRGALSTASGAKAAGFKPRQATLRAILNAAAIQGDVDMVGRALCVTKNLGYEADESMYFYAAKAFIQVGEVEKALSIASDLKKAGRSETCEAIALWAQSNVNSKEQWSLAVDFAMQNGIVLSPHAFMSAVKLTPPEEWDNVLEELSKLPGVHLEPVYNGMLNKLRSSGDYEEMTNVYKKMRANQVTPTLATFFILIKGAADKVRVAYVDGEPTDSYVKVADAAAKVIYEHVETAGNVNGVDWIALGQLIDIYRLTNNPDEEQKAKELLQKCTRTTSRPRVSTPEEEEGSGEEE